MAQIVETEDLSPEQRLMWFVLYTYFEDVDIIHRRKEKPLIGKNVMYRSDRPETNVFQLWEMINDEHTHMICDLAGVEWGCMKRNWRKYVWDLLSVRV